MSSTLEVGNAIVALVKEGKFKEAIEQYYAPDIVSVEAGPGGPQTVQGLDAIHAKTEWWESTMEVHGVTVEGPYPNGDQFILFYDLDVTEKEKGHRFNMKEAGLYTVKDGKIVHEAFFYSMG